MTTKLTVKRFRTRKADPVSPAQSSAAPVAPVMAQAVPANAARRPQVIGDDAFMPSADQDGFGDMAFPTARAGGVTGISVTRGAPAAPAMGAAEAGPEIDTIRREGLTGRQLRMARRLAQKHGLPATSDFDAVRLLRANGIDPFQTNSILDLVNGADGGGPPIGGSRALTVQPGGDGVRLPQTIKPAQLPSTEARVEEAHLAEVSRIQQDIIRRRRRKSILLAARVFVFVGLPTLLAAIYFYTIATPMYATKAEFVIQQAEPAAAAGMSSLLRNSPFATSQDSMAVQGYLQSQLAMERLEKDNGFRTHFSDPMIDPIQRLADGATETAAYKIFKKNVKISYDPTEGIIKMEVIAASPEKTVEFSKALIGYAEEQVEGLTQRLREDQMEGARESFDDAEIKLNEANRRVVELQEKFKILSSDVEVSLITSQIGGLESQLTQDKLSLAQMESNENPNLARMDPLKRRIATLEDEIQQLRAKLTEDSAAGPSIANIQSDLLVAQTDVQTRQLLLAQSLQSMESARLEANRQTRYLSLSVSPVLPDEAAYPRAFENTLVVMLIFAGIYLMISMTIAILREQVTS